MTLRDLTPVTLQRYFSAMSSSVLTSASREKIRTVLASVLNDTVKYGLLVTNPIENVRLPVDRRGKRRSKPHLSPEQFEQLISRIAEPYATMVYVAIFTGLRVSELAALRWEDITAIQSRSMSAFVAETLPRLRANCRTQRLQSTALSSNGSTA